MKKIVYTLSAAAVLLVSCGGESTTPEGGSDSTATATTETPVDNSIIDPLKDDLSRVITTAELINSMRVYYGKEVQLVVYPRVLIEGTAFEQDLEVAGSYSDEFNPPMHATINFKTVPTDIMVAGQAYLIKGVISELGTWSTVTITEAELLPLPADYKTEPFNPKAISSTAFYSPADILASMMAWDKKVITVTGDYLGTTISKSYDQTELLEARVDVGASGDDYWVGCGFEKEEDANQFAAGQMGVKVQGECSAWLRLGENPSLTKCTVVQ